MTLSKGWAMFGINLCASLYIGMGTYGSTLDLVPRMMDSLSVWYSLVYGIVALVLIRGLLFFGTLRDRIAAREALDLKRKERRLLRERNKAAQARPASPSPAKDRAKAARIA